MHQNNIAIDTSILLPATSLAWNITSGQNVGNICAFPNYYNLSPVPFNQIRLAGLALTNMHPNFSIYYSVR